MKALVLTIALGILSQVAEASKTVKVYFKNEDVQKIIEVYSKASGQKFVVDPAVRGSASILAQEPVSLEEFFNLMSSALALNGFAMSKQGDSMIVKTARNIQRDLIEVSPEKPALKPERMYTWVYSAKHLSVDELNRQLRILPSKDGEMAVVSSSNQIVFTDWTSNLLRIASILQEIDKPVNPAIAKHIKKSDSKPKATAKKE